MCTGSHRAERPIGRSIGPDNRTEDRHVPDPVRDRFEHRFTPGVDIGLRATLTREVTEGGESLGFGSLLPVSLADILPELRAEHERAVAAFEVLWTLVQEVAAELRARGCSLHSRRC